MSKIVLATAAVALAGLAYWHFVFISAADAARYRKACADWISTEFNGGRPAVAGKPWKAKGRIVFEVMAERESGEATTVFLCVVDKAAGTLLKPSAFSTAEWR